MGIIKSMPQGEYRGSDGLRADKLCISFHVIVGRIWRQPRFMSGRALRVLFHRQRIAQARKFNPDKSQSFLEGLGFFSLLRLWRDDPLEHGT